MKTAKRICVIALSMFFLNSCNEGPAEKKGKEIDRSVEKLQDKLQNKGPMQKAGEKVDDATGN